MASMKLAAAPEVYDRKRCVFFGNIDAFAAECVSNTWCLNRKKPVRGSSSYCGFKDGEILKAKAITDFPFSFVSGHTGGGPNASNKLKKFVVAMSDGNSGDNSVTELVKEHQRVQVDHATLVSPSLAPKNPVPKVVDVQTRPLKNNVGRVQGRKIWKRIHGLQNALRRNVSSTDSLISQQSIDYVQNSRKLDAALSAIGPESSVSHCMYILRLLERKSDEKALDFFKWMRSNRKLKHNFSAYYVILRVLVRKGDWDTAEMLIQEMASHTECHMNSEVFNSLINVCAKRGLADWGSKLFEMMLEKEVQPNATTIGMLMGLYQKNSNLLQAEDMFNRIRNSKFNCVTAYSAMITIYTRLGLYDKSEEIIRLMDEDGFLPDMENWLVRLNGYSQQGKLEKAESVLKLMRKAGFTPNIIAYNTLITGYGKLSDAEAAELVFQKLQTVGLEPDEATYRSMVEGFGRTGNYKQTMKYYEGLKKLGFQPNSSNFYTMINLHAKNGDDKDVIQIIEDMREAGCQYSSILSSLLKSYGRVCRIDKVPNILKASFYEKILLDQTSTSILVLTYVQNSLLHDALQVLREKKWKDSDYEDSLYHLLICSCKEAGRYEDAISIYAKMPLADAKPNLHIACSIIDIFTASNRFTDAENLYLKLRDSGVTFDMIAFSIVVRMYIKADSLKDACLVLDMMENQKDIVPDKFLFMDMLRVYQQCMMVEKLANVYYWILRSGAAWDEALYNCVINCCDRALPVDELSRIFNEMIQCGYAASTITFNVMLSVYGKAGLLEKARKVFWMARKQRLADVITYNTIISVHGKHKDLRGMKHFVTSMQHAGYPISLEAYNCMLDAYGKQGMLDEFSEVLNKMKEASCASDHHTYNIMINIYGKKGWIEEVAGVFADLKEHGLEPDLYSYNTLIKAYGIAGMVEEAVGVVKEMRSHGITPDRVTYSNLVVALQRNENFLEAVKWSLWMKQTGMS